MTQPDMLATMKEALAELPAAPSAFRIHECDTILFERLTRQWLVDSPFGPVSVPYVVSDAIPPGVAVVGDDERIVVWNLATGTVVECRWEDVVNQMDDEIYEHVSARLRALMDRGLGGATASGEIPGDG